MTENAIPPEQFVPLPYELQHVETLLASHTLPNSSLNDLELMYQCGWAAAISGMDSVLAQHLSSDGANQQKRTE